MSSIVLTMYQSLKGYSVQVCRQSLSNNGFLVVFREYGWQVYKQWKSEEKESRQMKPRG